MPLYGEQYDALDDAAEAALYQLSKQPRLAEQEYIAMLVRNLAGKYQRSEFQTQGTKDRSEFVGTPDGEMAGQVHNHTPNSPGDRYPNTSFSPLDIAATEGKYPNYILAVGSGKQLKSPLQGEEAVPGQEYLAQIPIKEIKQRIARSVQAMKSGPEVKARLMQPLL